MLTEKEITQLLLVTLIPIGCFNTYDIMCNRISGYLESFNQEGFSLYPDNWLGKNLPLAEMKPLCYPFYAWQLER